MNSGDDFKRNPGNEDGFYLTRPCSDKTPKDLAHLLACAPWWVWVWGFNTLFLGASYAVKAEWTGKKYVRKLAPNWEYTVGNWWSAMLPLAFAALTIAASMNAGRVSRRVCWALIILATLGLGLSLDELGSLHERASDLGPLDGLWNHAPLALLFVVVLTGSLTPLRGERKRLGPFVRRALLGFIILAIVEPMELIEHRFPWPALLEPASVALEEGLELLGGTVLVWAAIGLRKHLQSMGV